MFNVYFFKWLLFRSRFMPLHYVPHINALVFRQGSFFLHVDFQVLARLSCTCFSLLWHGCFKARLIFHPSGHPPDHTILARFVQIISDIIIWSHIQPPWNEQRLHPHARSCPHVFNIGCQCYKKNQEKKQLFMSELNGSDNHKATSVKACWLRDY